MGGYTLLFENNEYCNLSYIKENAEPLVIINREELPTISSYGYVTQQWVDIGGLGSGLNPFYSIDDVFLGGTIDLTQYTKIINRSNKNIFFSNGYQTEYRPIVHYANYVVDNNYSFFGYIGNSDTFKVGLLGDVVDFIPEAINSKNGWGKLNNVRFFAIDYNFLYQFDICDANDENTIIKSGVYAISDIDYGERPYLYTDSSSGRHSIKNVKFIGKGIFVTNYRNWTTHVYNINENLRFGFSESLGFLPNDPLSGGGISGVGGTGSGGTGGGNWSAPSDNINFPTTPTVPDIMKTGLFSAYAMTTAELQTFGDYLWNGDFFDIIQKIASDPLDSIIGLSVFPFDLSTVASESVPLKVGNATVNNLETVSKLQTNMKTISCGSINISHYSGNAMDYAPYTKLQIYLPYIGIRDLNINDFMNSIIKVDYAIDILTGSCCAYISTVNDGVNKVLYTFTGKMSADIPISGRNYATLVGAISTLATTGALASTLGGALPIAGATLLSASKMVANSQPQVEHSGNFNSHLSLNLLQTPYLIITRPRQSLPQSFNSFKGYPSNITERLGNLNGYTEVEYVHMDGFPNATKEEILEIETLLKSGVIL